jgi:hypothetical protein
VNRLPQQTTWPVSVVRIKSDSRDSVYASLDDLISFVSGCHEEPTREGVIELLNRLVDAYGNEEATDSEKN